MKVTLVESNQAAQGAATRALLPRCTICSPSILNEDGADVGRQAGTRFKRPVNEAIKN